MQIFIPPLCFENTSAIARPLRQEDASSLFEDLLGDPTVMHNTNQKLHTSIDETKTYIRLCEQSWNAHCGYIWGVEYKASRRLLGYIKIQAELPRLEFGMITVQKPTLQHKRTFFDLFLRILDWAIAEPDVHYAYAYSAPNSPSAQMAEHCKFKLEACLSNWESRPNMGLASVPIHFYGIARPFTDLVHFLHYTWFKKPELSSTLRSRSLIASPLEAKNKPVLQSLEREMASL